VEKYYFMNLDNLSAIKKLDEKNVAESISNLPKQLMAAWESGKKIKVPAAYGRASNIVFCGMGGSNLASELLKRVFGTQLKLPMILIRSYNLPSFVNSGSLVIIDSYSGNTEETIACLDRALKLKAKIICIASGGKVSQLAERRKLPLFKLNSALNPSGQPRYDIGSQLGATLMIFSKLKLIKIGDKELNEAAAQLVKINQNLLPNSPEKNNLAKQAAKELRGKNIYIIAAEFLSANAHILANQFNESAKQLASPLKIPELNHHFLEALTFPWRTMKDSSFIFLMSPNYNERITKRFLVTKKILDKKGIPSRQFIATSNGALNQALELLALGGWIGFYLAMLNSQNPAEIPWVNYFKQELEK
jgi:glucose/mannose-6-phosphate isomerase